MSAIWSLVPLPSLKPNLKIWKFTVHILLKSGLENLGITLKVCEISAVVQYFEHILALPFFGIGKKTDLFQSCGHCSVFQICWHIECSTFTASSFRIWNSSTGTPSPSLPLSLFIVMLPKAYLTSHSRMSGSWWVIASSSLSGSWKSFLYNSFVYSCHLFLISLLLLGPYRFCPLLCPSLHEMFPWDL